MPFQWNLFNSRRAFFKTFGGFLVKFASVAGLLLTGVRSAGAFFKKQLLPVGTDPARLYDEDPQYLDTRNLEVTPIIRFDTMGDTRVAVDLTTWRLKVTGNVRKPLRLSYPDLLELPSIQKKVLLICAGIFSYHAEYTGISMQPLLERCEAAKAASRVTFYGLREIPADKKERFSIDEITGDKLFLAYAVNGQPLPQPHGFPLRLVAEDHAGNRWVKYVHKVTID